MNNAKYQADVANSNKRQVASFVHMVTEGEMSYTMAWETIVSRTSLGPVERAELWKECLAAAPSAMANIARN